jgi:hypothetical protein
MAYFGLLHIASFVKAETYLKQLQNGEINPGRRLANTLDSSRLKILSVSQFVECLVNTKPPQIFAESSVKGDGSDWNQIELSILGDLSMAIDVTVFDNGLHYHPLVHPSPFEALLIYTPGALLRNETGNPPVDWHEVVIDNQINYPAFLGLYERRLLPCLIYANGVAHCKGVKAIITLPGLGCGQFAGKFKGQLGSLLKQVLCDLVKKYHTQLPAIRAIYYDPFDECDNERIEMGNISLLVRPLLRGNESKGQLSLPNTFEDVAGEFSDCLLTSLVAWDHVSWPGNDFYIGSRATDDGVKAAATNTMQVMTGCEGRYCLDSNKYLPPKPYDTWDELIAAKKLSLHCNTNLKVYDPRG